MAVEPKPFQLATIEAALATLENKSGPRRFLVADEVGLGKTIVARGIIERMSKHPSRRPFSVLYVCSNLTIAKQNLSRLIGFLDKKERDTATCHVDRPSLLVTRDQPTHPRVRIFRLTPDTAIPTRRGHRGGGRKEERALAFVMLSQIMDELPHGLKKALMGSVGKERFEEWVRYFAPHPYERSLGGGEYRDEFKVALRDVLGMDSGQHLPPRIRDLVSTPRDLIAATRSALALSALRLIKPQLVVFDEFQKFSDLVQDSCENAVRSDGDAPEPEIKDRAAARVLDAIRGQPYQKGPALLLLSATPYEPFRGRVEKASLGGAGNSRSRGFFELVEFLSGCGDEGRDASNQAEKLFDELSEELRKGVPDSVRAQKIRASLLDLLTPLISRTERPQHGMEAAGAKAVDVDLHASDMREFRRLHACFADTPSWVLPMWQSVPLPMQTLGHRYLAWKQSKPELSAEEPALTRDRREAFLTPSPWPHPRLRALQKSLPPRELQLPWVAPSMPWWPLAGGWKSEGPEIDGKLLVFSRFRAVPTALAGLISYSLESSIVQRYPSPRKQVAKRQWLQPDPKRAALLELFYPSPFLASLEPLAATSGTPLKAIAAIRKRLRSRLGELGVRVTSARSSRPTWKLVVALDAKSGGWDSAIPAWEAVLKGMRGHADQDAGNRLAGLIEQWEAAAGQELSELSGTELDALVQLALDSPAVVLFRALKRHWPEAAQHFDLVLGLTWRGLRTYFDSPWFAATLESREERHYPPAIRRAVVDGNLEAVLDEHFWYLDAEGSDSWPERLEQLEATLKLRDVSVTVHERGPSRNGAGGEFRLGCHVAVPLTEAKIKSSGDTTKQPSDGGEEDLRPDLVRRAFNAPFWPKVLITTSVGQEGLDFHPWCRALAHWDLATGPVALEQREGRISRFAGLAVRRVIAERLSSGLNQVAPEGNDRRLAPSPWVLLAERAADELCDDSGLSPWWFIPAANGYGDSSCNHLFFALPGSELRQRHADLAKERALYRLVLGMPDQADLISHLSAHGVALDPSAVRRACINLCAFDRYRAKRS